MKTPRPSSSLKQDSSNNLQSRHLSYSRHSCCNGSLELHLHVIGVKDYICIHVQDNTYPRACLLWKFKLKTDPRGTITTFCANTKPKIFTTGKVEVRGVRNNNKNIKLTFDRALKFSKHNGNLMHFYSQSRPIAIRLLTLLTTKPGPIIKY